MAIFGRNTARQRLRRATRESLTIPAFSSPVDCTPWVVGAVWPAELSRVTPETVTAAEHLRLDLQRIADSANEELKAIRRTIMPDAARRAEETRVINTARGFAIRLVESTVRHLHTAAQQPPSEQRGAEKPDVADLTDEPADTDGRDERYGRHAAAVMAEGGPRESADAAKHAKPVSEDEDPGASSPTLSEADAAVSADAGIAAVLYPFAVANPEHKGGDAAEKAAPAAEVEPEGESSRLWRLLQFVARQEPGLRWAAGDREDGTTVLVTDLAHGWIPPGITLPAGVCLLQPDQRSGNAAALLAPVTLSATYAPGDPLGWATDTSSTEPSLEPRQVPEVDDLGWVLSEATHWRDGLPRMVNTLARAGAAGTGVVEAEVDVLRVHLDTARYQLLAQYPDVDAALLLNCLLLAATEGVATGDRISANYHFAWFQRLDIPPPSKWSGGS